MVSDVVAYVPVKAIPIQRNESYLRLYFTGDLKGDYELNLRSVVAVVALFSAVGTFLAFLALCADGVSLVGRAITRKSVQAVPSSAPVVARISPAKAACRPLVECIDKLRGVPAGDQERRSEMIGNYNQALRALIRGNRNNLAAIRAALLASLQALLNGAQGFDLNGVQIAPPELVNLGCAFDEGTEILGFDEEREVAEQLDAFRQRLNSGNGLAAALQSLQFPEGIEAHRGFCQSVQIERFFEVRDALFLDCYWGASDLTSCLDMLVNEQLLSADNRNAMRKEVLSMLFRKLLEEARSGKQVDGQLELFRTQWKDLVEDRDQELQALVPQLQALIPPSTFFQRLFG